MQQKDKVISHEMPGKPWEVIIVDLFTINNSNFLCVVDYHSKLPIVRKAGALSAGSLNTCCKIIFAEYEVSKKIMLNVGTNFASENFQDL